jgi:hypothetical protein
VDFGDAGLAAALRTGAFRDFDVFGDRRAGFAAFLAPAFDFTGCFRRAAIFFLTAVFFLDAAGFLAGAFFLALRDFDFGFLAAIGSQLLPCRSLEILCDAAVR